MRLKEIDNLRGLAIFLVFLAHSGIYNFSEKISSTQLGNLSGLVGVYIFFIVSGYCIINSISKIHNTNKLKNKITICFKFLSKRFLRLYPLYWLSIFLYIFFINNNFDYKTILLNLTMVQFFLNVEMVQGVYWSLSFEIFFYSIVLFLILININRDICLKVLIFILISSIILSLISNYININLKFYALYLFSLFFFGIITFYNKLNFNFIFKIACLSFLSLIIIFALNKFDFNLFSPKELSTLENNEIILLTLANFLALATYCYCFFKQKTNIFLIFLGKISYSMYLTHEIAIQLVLNLKLDGFFIPFILNLTLSVLIAYLLHIIFEKRFVSLIKRINY